jgi:arylsulfatase A-like enzyme
MTLSTVKQLVILITLAMTFAIAPNSFAADSGGRPNVLMIAVDDLNDWIGPMRGHSQTITPNLDRLAARGMVFTNAHCAAPACNPSRAALMSGVRPWNSGVYINPQPWRPVMPDIVTIPQHFMAHGYHARAGGKIYHGAYEDRASWNTWFEGYGDQPKLNAAEQKNPHARAGGIVWGNLHDTPVSELGDYKLATWVSEFLSQKHDQPFFVGCGFKKPHMPWQVPGEYYDKFPVEDITIPYVPEHDLDDIPKAGLAMAKPAGDHAKILKSENWKHAVQGYLATINFMDEQLGRVLDALDNGPNADNTIVFLWGDHGWHLGEKQHWRKFSLWEEATKAPLIFAVPGVTKPGSRCDAPVDFMSIYPTIVDLAGLPLPAHLDGVSIKPLLQDPNAKWDRPAITTHGRNNNAVRTDRYRYIRYANGDQELYDHDHDPMEFNNLAGDKNYASLMKKLGAYMPNANQSVKDAPRDPRK